MNATASTPIDAEAKNAPMSGKLFFLNLSGGRILSANPDGSDLKTIINEGRKLPDGLVLLHLPSHTTTSKEKSLCKYVQMSPMKELP